MSITLTALQKQRTDTAANWTTANPTLLSGELGFESDTGKMKLGNGSTAWNSLAYLILIPSSGVYPGTQLLMPLGSASTPSLTFNGDPNTGIYSPGADQVALSTGGTGRLFINSSGLVGIGGATSSWSLHVQSAGQRTTVATESISGGTSGLGRFLAISDSGNAEFGMSGSGYTDITGASDACIINANAASNGICFAINSVLRAKIDSSGRLGLGTSSPGSRLTVNRVNYADASATGSTTLSNAGITVEAATDTNNRLMFGIGSTGGAPWIQAQNTSSNATQSLILNPVGGNVGIGTTTPGAKLEVSTGSADIYENIRLYNRSSGNHTRWGILCNHGDNTKADVQLFAGVSLSDNTSNTIGIGGGEAGSGKCGVSDIIFRTTATPGTANSASERARIDSSGRLLVGTSSSNSTFDSAVQIAGTGANSTQLISRFVANSNGPRLYISKSRGSTVGTNTIVASGDELGSIEFRGANGSGYDAAASITALVDGTPGSNNDMPGRLVFSTTADGASSPTERTRITNAGAFYHFSASSDTIAVASTKAAGTTDYFFTGGYSSSGPMNFGTNSLRIYTNGNVQNTNNSYTAISDAKLKENIIDANSQWADLKALRVRNYNLKEGQTHRQIGLIAQEVEPISPGLVYESPDRDAEGNDLGTVTKSVNYSVLYMKAVKALQEAMERIETLEAEVAALKGA